MRDLRIRRQKQLESLNKWLGINYSGDWTCVESTVILRAQRGGDNGNIASRSSSHWR